jgi:hypothetical protein
MHKYAACAQVFTFEMDQRESYEAALRAFRAFSPTPDLAVNSGDYPLAREFVVSMDLQSGML